MAPKFFIARITASFTHYNKLTQIEPGSCCYRLNTSPFFFNTFTSDASSDSKSDTNNHKGDTFTVSFLINSCGVSPNVAKKLSKVVHLKNPNTPNAVLHILRHYGGFSKTQIAILVQKRPLLLASNAEKTLLPKLKFLHSIGVSNVDMPKIIISNPTIILRSLENWLIPRCEVLRSVLRDDREVVRTLKNWPLSRTYSGTMSEVVMNIEVLRQCGVPQTFVSLLMIHSGSVLHAKHSKFVEIVNTVKQIGFNPLRATFVSAIEVLMKRKGVLQSRRKVYQNWGWDCDMALRAFKKFPSFMKLSEETLIRKMNFLVKEIGLSPEVIAEYPQVLAYNMEKRIIPRFSVIKVLKSKGLLKNKLQYCSLICLSEEDFLEKFVFNFQKDLPLLPDVYKGVVNHSSVM